MDCLPKEIEDIIIDYKEHFEHQQNVKQHFRKFYKSLMIITKLNHEVKISIHSNRQILTERLVIIGPIPSNEQNSNYIYDCLFSICLLCNNYNSSGRMRRQFIANRCRCKCNL